MVQSADERSRFRRSLLAWFDENQRDLPWRRRKSAYRVWISEIMLQQTQVTTVIDYFQRFVRQFPDVGALAAAPEDEVLRAWEGLGYYRRAKQLHAAARQIVARHGGQFPDAYEQVLALPGIGRYTAGAILSIAADQPWPVLEGNTVRLYARLLDFRQDVTTTASQRQLWEFAESLVSRHRPGDLNQALMELGSQICQSGRPRCLLCPVQRFCQAFKHGIPESLPHKGTQKTRYESLHQAVAIIRRGQRVVLRRCGPDEHWAGLWDFPRFTIDPRSEPPAAIASLRKQVGYLTGLDVELQPADIPTIRHAVTRFRISLECFRAVTVTGRLRRRAGELEWVPTTALPQRPMSVTGRKIVRHLA